MKQILLQNKPTHLSASVWEKAHKILLKKALEEFLHERIISPNKSIPIDEKQAWYLVYPLENNELEYRFKAQKLSLNHWLVDINSIEKTKNKTPIPLDIIDFIIEFKKEAGFSQKVLPIYLEELISTLYARAYVLSTDNEVSKLVDADFQTIEGSTTGHPTFIATNGRVGFSALDYADFAPETKSLIHLVWLAVHKEQCVFACTEDLSYYDLIIKELGEDLFDRFNKIIIEQNRDPKDYYYMPVHPWQWSNKMSPLFAPALATKEIIYLGVSKDKYQAQQSVRTFFNRSNPKKYYVKVALSVLNMGFMRGLSPYYMESTPAINTWVENTIKQDDFLNKCGFSILKEVAAIGYKNDYYERALDNQNHTPYTKMLASLWRENPMNKIAPNQRLMTMAALLHVDNQGKSLMVGLIKKSGLSTKDWLIRYLEAYLIPILHCFYKYDMVFMPHGENLIMVLEDYVPVKMFMKDIGEEVAIMNEETQLPGATNRIGVKVPDDFKLINIFTDVFDCFLRYMSALLHEQTSFNDTEFWKTVYNSILHYQKQHPELKAQFKKYDINTPKIKLCCLNRLQIKNNKQMVDLSDPINSLQFAGEMENPLYQMFKINSFI